MSLLVVYVVVLGKEYGNNNFYGQNSNSTSF